MLPQRPTGSFNVPNGARKSGTITFAQVQSFEVLKARVLARLEDRLDPGASKRMPASLLRQSIRTHAEQVAELEARGLSRGDRDRLVDEVLSELLGYGPLAELFNDPTVREILVAGPSAVIVRREQASWLPTSIKYRDEQHVRWSLDKLATHADPVGGTTLSLNLFDLLLPNGFRAVGVVPPAALGQPATAAFLRVEAPAASSGVPAISDPPSSTTNRPVAASAGSTSASSTRPAPNAGPLPSSAGRPSPIGVSGTPRTGSAAVSTPPPRNLPGETAAPAATDLSRHRNRIIERLISKLANLGVYDLKRFEIAEFRKVIAAYVREYVEAENIYLSETDQGRLMLEILTTMQRS
jgi:hypothetical protein